MDDSRAPDAPASAAGIPQDVSSLHAVLGNVSSMVVGCQDDGTMVFVGGALTGFLGYERSSVINRNFSNFVHNEDLARALEGIARWHGRSGAPVGSTVRLLCEDGSYRPFHYSTRFGDDVFGPGSFIVTLTPPEYEDPHGELISALVANEERVVRMASAFLDIDPDAFDDGIESAVRELSGLNAVTRVTVWMVEDGRLVRTARWDAELGAPTIDPPATLNSSHSMMLKDLLGGSEIRFSLTDASDDRYEVERSLFAEAGTVSLLAAPIAIRGEVKGALILESTLADVGFNVTHVTSARSACAIIAAALVRQGTENELAERARLDPTTGLLNRWYIQGELQRALDHLRAGSSRGVGVAMIDLDRFKLVNEALGHRVGDRLLRDVAERFSRQTPEEVMLARLSADEFLIVDPDVRAEQDVVDLVRSLVDALDAPFVLDGNATTVSATSGITHVPDTCTRNRSAEEILRRLEATLDRAKETGSGLEVGDATDDRHLERLRRIDDLKRGLAGDELVPYFQGEWDIRAGRIIGAEALVRWQHPVDGLVGALELVPLAESSRLVNQLGRQVLIKATRAARAWIDKDPEFLLRVNISAQQLRNEDFTDEVAEILADMDYPARSLCLELTESMLLDDPLRSGEQFARLRELGVGLAIDDFGTGYSSVLQLKELPLTSLKIDQRFVAGLGENRSDRAIVEATLELAEAFGVTATAEGVETEQQRDVLLELDCVHAQGYLLSKPEPEEDFALHFA